MKNLDSITFAGNPIRSVSNLVSQSLLDLNLSGCMLTTLKPTVFEGLSKLKNLDLSKNYRLSLINVESRTLERIDLSYCNMDIISLDGFPSLRTAILKGNMIRSLNKNDFSNNLALENLDISYNVITTIHPNTFATLKNLQNLNLLYNSIGKIERDTFKENKLLFRLNLSKNHIGRFNRIKAESLIYLNMSWCEILEIDADALAGMPNIIELDLTGNLISTLPVLDSKTLQTLDLSINRISQISAVTFSSLTELIKINLSGNRFSIPFSRSYFYNNSILNEIWLGDNPWICNCHDNKFYDFFTYLTEYPSRLNDRSTLKCASPEEIAGRVS
jgi:Leucine-rich repeat (LRR) protein